MRRPDVSKLTQAVAYLLRLHNGVMTRMRILKLLYLADRQLLQLTRRTLTDDRACAMDHGPVLSRTYDLLKGVADNAQAWDLVIERVPPHEHRLRQDPGVGRLSKLELQTLEELTQRHWLTEDFGLSQLTHDFPEWRRHRPAPGQSAWIPHDDLLAAVGLGAVADQIRQEAQADAELDALLTEAAR